MNNFINQKIALVCEYDGSQFHGWQKQDNLRTVQGHIEQALSCIAEMSITTHCAGRTDAGVHAKQQVIHFETPVERPLKAWIHGTNTHLPCDIRILFAKLMPDDFHARFSAIARRYQYVILNRPIAPAIQTHYLTWEYRPLNIDFMNKAAHYLLGEHDFSSFRAAECQSKSPYRHIDHLKIIRNGEQVIIDIKANAFLHHMVRNIAGMLISIGAGAKPIDWAKEVLLAKDRRAADVTAPPKGLFLTNVYYPEQYLCEQELNFVE
ncbi:MAG: tRNA pseudouridine(38-40) synthase TruA [Gammaproteobacteria bacterium]